MPPKKQQPEKKEAAPEAGKGAGAKPTTHAAPTQGKDGPAPSAGAPTSTTGPGKKAAAEAGGKKK